MVEGTNGGWRVGEPFKMLDRRGYAPRTAGCKPADFLTNLAAHERHGVSVLPRARGVLEIEAPASMQLALRGR